MIQLSCSLQTSFTTKLQVWSCLLTSLYRYRWVGRKMYKLNKIQPNNVSLLIMNPNWKLKYHNQ